VSRVKRLDHIALVVDDVEAALAFWRDALGLPLERLQEVPEQQATVAFLPVGGFDIELVRPTTSDSGVARYLAKRGPGMHHLCLEVEDLDKVLERLQRLGVRLINPQPVPGTGGKRIAFIHPESAYGVLVELSEAPRA
jgi:methylmalonyl-CoA/ethylmalonyl-CoA epimerase